MAKWLGHTNSGKSISPADVRQIRQMARGNTPTRVIGGLIGRSEGAVRSIASTHGISLKPANQSPNKGKKK